MPNNARAAGLKGYASKMQRMSAANYRDIEDGRATLDHYTMDGTATYSKSWVALMQFYHRQSSAKARAALFQLLEEQT